MNVKIEKLLTIRRYSNYFGCVMEMFHSLSTWCM